MEDLRQSTAYLHRELGHSALCVHSNTQKNKLGERAWYTISSQILSISLFNPSFSVVCISEPHLTAS